MQKFFNNRSTPETSIQYLNLPSRTDLDDFRNVQIWTNGGNSTSNINIDNFSVTPITSGAQFLVAQSSTPTWSGRAAGFAPAAGARMPDSAPVPTAPALTADQQAPIVAAAKSLWVAAGVSPTALANVSVVIADLPDNALGMAVGTAITTDPTAAGYGWFVDRTPADGKEFRGRQRPKGMDLLTVVGHELGHVLGLHEHGQSRRTSVMAESLTTGVRRKPSRADVALLDDYLAHGGFVG